MRGRLALVALLLATACSGRGEPSEDQLRNALAQSGNRGGPKAVKLACQRVPDKPGFVCDYRAPACNRYTGACGSAKPGSGRFVEAGGRWQLVEDMTPKTGPAAGTQPLPGPSGGIPTDPTPVPTEAPTDQPVMPTPVPFPDPAPDAGPAPAPHDYDDEPFEERRLRLSQREAGMVARWAGLTARCRIDEGASEEARDACFERDDLAQRMRRRGLCYGGGDAQTVARWHRCE